MSDIAITFQSIIVFQCFFFVGFLLLSRRRKNKTNRILSVLLFILGLHMLLNLVGYTLEAYGIQKLTVVFGFLYGPILYIYCLSLAFQSFRVQRTHCWHLLAAAVVFVLTIWLHLPVLIYAIGILLSLGIYCSLSWYRLFEYRKALEFTRSEFDEISLNWLSKLLWIALALLVMNIVNVALDAAGIGLNTGWAEVAQFALLLFLVSFIIFNGLQHPDLFNGLTDEDAKLPQDTLQEIDRLTEQQVEEIITMLDQYMEEHQSYIDPNLTIKVLSRRVSLSVRDVSQAINTGKRQNFSEYVNSFRIDYAKQLLQDNQMTVLDIMYQSGFNTKSNFNRVFKKLTKTTPQEFRESRLP